jgi:hypothetical protein
MTNPVGAITEPGVPENEKKPRLPASGRGQQQREGLASAGRSSYDLDECVPGRKKTQRGGGLKKPGPDRCTGRQTPARLEVETITLLS